MTMMRIATTRSRDMQPLALGGQLVIDAAASITAVLTRSLSPAHAALFAEPEADAERGEIDWYAEVDGPLAVLSELPEAEAAASRERLDSLTTDISALAARLAASEAANERRIGEILLLALNVPAASAIRTIGGRPVLVGWGHRAADAGGRQVAVQGLARAQTVDAPMEIFGPPASPWASPRPPARQFGWPLLALALLLLIPGLWLLNHDLALLSARQVCRIDRADLANLDRWRQVELQGTELDNRLAALVAQAASARHHCQVAQAQPDVAPVTAPGGGT